MKDIESRLNETPAPLPRRPLSSDFTRQTMAQVRKEKRTTLRLSMLFGLASFIQGFKPMHRLSKPAALVAGIAVITITAGTSFAAIQWLRPKVSVDKQGTITLPNGNIRTWLTLESCQGQQGIPTPERNYYEIKAGTSMTPEKLANGLEAMCEADLVNELFADVVKKIPKDSNALKGFKPGQEQFSFPYSKLKEVHGDRLVLDNSLNGEQFSNVSLPLAADARIYAKGKAIKLSELKPGSDLTLVLRTTALDRPFSTETMRPDEINKLAKDGYPIGATIIGVVEHVYPFADAAEISQKMGYDWTRLTQSKDSGEWQQIVPLDNKQ